MRIKKFLAGMAVVFLLLTTQGEAGIFISEFLADPATDTRGDANGDGVVSASGDEFVELFNDGLAGVDLSGWFLADSSRLRHLFAAGTVVPPKSFMVVFGAGQNVSKPDNWQWASTGTLSLNNATDEIFLFDNFSQSIDHIFYAGEANNDQALARSPEGSKGNFILHMDLAGAAGKRFSPGYFVGNPISETQTVPEPASGLSLALGLAALLKARGKRKGDE